MKVWRDADGNPVHIGEWDHQVSIAYRNPLPNDLVNRPERVPLLRNGEPVLRPIGRPGEAGGFEPVMTDGPPRWFRGDDLIHEGEWDPQPEETQGNPIPDGVSSSEEDVATRVDGGVAAAGDYQSLRRAAYPTIKDQLDALWKGGAEAEAMRASVLAVKAQYPKPGAEKLLP
jgi:hypothetical protein